MKKYFLQLIVAAICCSTVFNSSVNAQGSPSTGVTVAGGSLWNANPNFGIDTLPNPFGITLDGSGNMYITEVTGSRIIKWTQNTPNVKSVAAGYALGGGGNDAYHLNSPFGACLDKNGNLYISDQVNNRVQRWAIGATRGVTVAGDSNGVSGIAANLLNSPAGVCVDTGGNIYVADLGNNRIQKWTPGAANGITVAGDSLNTPFVTGYGYLNMPNGVFVDGKGNMYIADGGDNVVIRCKEGEFTPYNPEYFITNNVNYVPFNKPYSDIRKNYAAGLLSQYLSGSNYQPDSVANSLRNPVGIVVDKYDNVYVSDMLNNRVQKWTPYGTRGMTVAGDSTGIGDTSSARLWNPYGIYLDSIGNLYVADSRNERIQKWNVPITKSPGVLLTCSQSVTCPSFSLPDTFIATPANGGSHPIYHWYKNGVLINNDSSAIYIDPALANLDSIWVEIVSNDSLLTTPIAFSRKIIINGIAPPIVIITGDTAVCPSTFLLANLTTTDSSSGIFKTWTWSSNNGFIDSLPATSVSTSGNYCVTVTDYSGCTASACDSIKNVLGCSVSPSVSINASKTVFCLGYLVADTFTASALNGGINPIYHWYKNSVLNANDSLNIYIDNSITNNDSIWVIMTSSDTSAHPNTAISSIIVLRVNSPATSIIYDTICQGSSVIIGTNSHSTQGTHIDTLLGAAATGCDSIVTLILTVKSPASSSTTTSICQGDSVWSGSNLYFNAGTHIDTLRGAASNGCDSIVTLILNVNPKPTVSITGDSVLCPGDTAHLTAVASGGNPAYTYSWGVTGSIVHTNPVALTTTGNYCLTVVDANTCTATACDSISPSTRCCSVALSHTNLDSFYTVSAHATGHGRFTYNWSMPNGSNSTFPDPTYTITTVGANQFCVTVTDTTGCAATGCTTVVDSLNYPTPPVCRAYLVIRPDTSVAGNYIAYNYSQGVGITYLWHFGDGDSSTLQLPSHTYAAPGRYTVCLTVTNGRGCTSTFCDSSFYAYKTGGGPMSHLSARTTTAINDVPTTGISIYPNPTNSELTIEAAGNKVEQVRLFNVNGQKVAEFSNPANNKIAVSELTNGIYFIEATVKGSVLRAKFVKE